ncbi:hypothetical protein M378DRAFT_316308 [Amanita muscaria Koide BX008]|uniref:Uncharacterized protein n=1 Tax=Amanita muscaria (strain Koide BX008) TaxID=946122 RepID=A0A0C2SWK4_AMAMK|nr:hypothetical protein M378DRAFT_316308 [Amanita muscaria Koide BX008]
MNMFERMDFDSLKDAQSDLGADTVIIMDKSTDIIAAIARFSHVRVQSLTTYIYLILTPWVVSFTDTNHADSAHHVGKVQRR